MLNATPTQLVRVTPPSVKSSQFSPLSSTASTMVNTSGPISLPPTQLAPLVFITSNMVAASNPSALLQSDRTPQPLFTSESSEHGLGNIAVLDLGVGNIPVGPPVQTNLIVGADSLRGLALTTTPTNTLSS
ncbi:hypothetical protein SLA2020_051430 [Shorea laevis]